MKKSPKKYLSVMLLASASAAAFTGIPAGPQAATDHAFLERARSMNASGNYRGAVDQIEHIITENISLPHAEAQEMLFLLASSYAETSDPRCLKLLEEYIALYPASADAREARLALGDFRFFAHDWSEALAQYDLIDLNSLDATTRDLYSYRKALCLIHTGDAAAARPLIKSLAGKKEYAMAALYYDAYIDYEAGQDEKALGKFMRISEKIAANPTDRSLAELHPNYYIAQLLFRKGDWKQCANVAMNLLRRNEVPELATDTRRVLGLSLYEMGDMAQACGVLESYVDEAGADATPDALYALGACEYDMGRLTDAALHFERVIDTEGPLAQGAYLYLGQIEAAAGNPSGAAMNFEKAYRMDYDHSVAETALYNYVAARSRGGNIPFDTSVDLLERFVASYPTSEYAPVIERHLASLYYGQGDYDKALRSIDRISNPSRADIAILQKILYAAGSARLSAGDPRQAAPLLQRCTALRDADPDIRAQASIWLGDALYALADYAGAESAYAAAANSGRAGSNAALLDYDLGYALLMQDKFGRAAQYFRKAASAAKLPASMRRDAAMRVADCKYYTGDYSGALADFAALRDGENADYALYRHAQMLGLQGDTNGKIRELQQFEREYSGSRWLSNALNELADTYASKGDNVAAAYGRMLERYPVAPGAAKAALGRATALMASGDTEGAVDAYRELLESRPASDEARVADRELRRYYADNHQLSEYADFLRDIPGYTLDAADMDDLAYEAAENAYLDKADDVKGIREYIARYPDGRHIAEAYSIYAGYLADNADRKGALAAYRELERHGGAEYASEAYTGIMRNADNTATRLEYARKLRQSGGADADALEEADFYEATALAESGSAADARRGEQMLRRLAANPFSLSGARSAVTLAQIHLDNSDAATARDMMEEFTSSGSGQQYWVARGFIVLADAYTALGKDYLAQEYLRSLRQNYPGDEEDIRRMISKRLK